MHRFVVGLVLAGTCLLASSCGAPVPTVGEGQEALPRGTTQDLVTYGDLVVTVVVTAESRVPMTDAERRRGEGMDLRQVDLAVGRTAWERSGAPQDVPATITLTNGGWWITRENGRLSERAVRTSGQTHAETGHDYLAILVHSDITAIVDPATRTVTPGEGPAWVVLELAPLVNGVVSAPTERGTTRAVQEMAGLTPGEVGELLRRTSPDPAAARYMDLDPVVRHQYVQFDAARAAGPASGER